MSFLSNLFSNPKSDESSILNVGLDMAMEFGEHFRQPIQQRLSKKYSSLTTEQLDQYNTICKSAMDSGFAFVNTILENIVRASQTIKEAELKRQLTEFMKAHYPWINQNNLDRLHSQGCYFAFKNGWDQGIGQ